jgi:uncharacterized protein YndB with AHSA1/START domain
MKPVAIVLLSLFATSAVSAKTEAVGPSGFKVSHEVATAADPATVWKALGGIGRWWDPQHTWSGDARNMHIDLKAGGCFCETWKDQSVEHSRVIWSHKNTRLRMLGAFGPLQEWGVSGVAEFAIKPGDGGSTIVFTYNVSGDARFKLDGVAAIVDQVLGTQVQRLANYAATGSPDAGR